jgi:hypothetical protein
MYCENINKERILLYEWNTNHRIEYVNQILKADRLCRVPWDGMSGIFFEVETRFAIYTTVGYTVIVETCKQGDERRILF